MIRVPFGLALCALAISTSASAQSPGDAVSALTPQRITAPIKHRGTYHVETGSWSRAIPSAASASDVLYNNSAPSGYFFGSTPVWSIVDHGRVPSHRSPSNATSVTGTADLYVIDCFEIAYCSSISDPGGLTVATIFWELYAPCGDIDAPVTQSPVASYIATGLPAGTPTGGQGCWIMAIDLGTDDGFLLEGDADGSWDDDPNVDSFGWTQLFPDAAAGPSGNGTGPLIAGRCPTAGAGSPTVPQQGFGTQFGGVPGATDATGLGTDDFFWVDANDGGLLIPNANGGCFFFGGCTGPGVTGPAHNPFGGFWLRIFGDEFEGGGPGCPSYDNATGAPARISATFTDPNVDLVLTSTPVPNTTGLFFHGPMMLSGGLNLGDGARCVGGMTTRMLPFILAGMMMQLANTATLAVNYTAPYAAGLTGRRHFQHWFRSGLSIGTGSNTSDQVTIDF